MPKIIIKVKDGKVVMDFYGFDGDECVTEASKIVEKMRPEEVDVKLKRQVDQSNKNTV